MSYTGAPGSSRENPEPPPRDVEWVVTASGYRVGVRPGDGELVIEVLDYHPGYLVLERDDLAKLEARLSRRT